MPSVDKQQLHEKAENESQLTYQDLQWSVANVLSDGIWVGTQLTRARNKTTDLSARCFECTPAKERFVRDATEGRSGHVAQQET